MAKKSSKKKKSKKPKKKKNLTRAQIKKLVKKYKKKQEKSKAKIRKNKTNAKYVNKTYNPQKTKKPKKPSKNKKKQIGNFGKGIVFKVSQNKILTFEDFERTTAGRWAEHERLNKIPKKQFLGAGAQKITFTVTLAAEHKVNPRKMADKIRKMVTSGKPQYLVIGKKKVFKNKAVITEMTERWQHIMKDGGVAMIICDLTFEEYA